MSQPDPAEICAYLVKLRATKESILAESDRLMWQARFLNAKASKVDDEIDRVMAMLNPAGTTALVKYDEKLVH